MRLRDPRLDLDYRPLRQVRRARQKRKRGEPRRWWSQRELAERAGCSRQTVTRIEAGQLQPSAALLIALAGALDVRPDELVHVNRYRGKALERLRRLAEAEANYRRP